MQDDWDENNFNERTQDDDDSGLDAESDARSSLTGMSPHRQLKNIVTIGTRRGDSK